MTEEFAWKIYNTINLWKNGGYGETPLQQVLDKIYPSNNTQTCDIDTQNCDIDAQTCDIEKVCKWIKFYGQFGNILFPNWEIDLKNKIQ